MARILICDDAMFMRMILKNTLEKEGHEVIGEAVNGLDAVNKYKSLHPDLVMLDITMPEMDGLHALKHIISIDPHAKAIICSAMGQKPMILDAMKAGAVDFVVKPFQQEYISEVIKKALKNKQ